MHPCPGCQDSIAGPPDRHCKTCAIRVHLERRRAQRMAIRVTCVDCGTLLLNRQQVRWSHKRPRCLDCARLYRQQQPSALSQRMASRRFDHLAKRWVLEGRARLDDLPSDVDVDVLQRLKGLAIWFLCDRPAFTEWAHR
jgi:hypothetical protein